MGYYENSPVQSAGDREKAVLEWTIDHLRSLSTRQHHHSIVPGYRSRYVKRARLRFDLRAPSMLSRTVAAAPREKHWRGPGYLTLGSACFRKLSNCCKSGAKAGNLRLQRDSVVRAAVDRQ